MLPRIKIALQLPESSEANRHFSIRLQADLRIQPCIYNSASLLFVVSDVKSNFRSFYKLLITHKIIDRYFNWTFGEGHLVVLGNSFDNKPLIVEYLWFLYSMEQKARKAGGYVHFVLGPQEIMHMNGKWRNDHPRYAAIAGKGLAHSTALYNANLELKNWLATRNVLEKIGNFIFTHGDTLPCLDTQNLSIDKVNAFVRSFYANLPETITEKMSLSLLPYEEIFLQDKGNNGAIFTEQRVNVILEKFVSDLVIVGHVIQSHISFLFNGKMLNVATDHSKDQSEGLMIREGEFLRAGRQGQMERIKN